MKTTALLIFTISIIAKLHAQGKKMKYAKFRGKSKTFSDASNAPETTTLQPQLSRMERLQLSKQLFEMAKVGNCSGARDLIRSGADLFFNQGFIFYGVSGNALLRATYENDVDCVREITEGLNEVGKIGQINEIEREYGMSPFCYVRKSQGVIQELAPCTRIIDRQPSTCMSTSLESSSTTALIRPSWASTTRAGISWSRKITWKLSVS